jgi:ribose transport system substrate-binding protein
MGLAGLALPALLAGCDLGSGNCGIGTPPNNRRLKAAYINDGLAHSWCAQGKQTAETWGKWFGVDVTWFDGKANVVEQRKALDVISTRQWDFVAIQALSVDTLIDPVQTLLDRGIPVIEMDTQIDSSGMTPITTHLGADQVAMAVASSRALFEAMGGKGTVIMTQGMLGHTGAQDRAKGFYQTLAKYPAIKVLATDSGQFDVNVTTQLWRGYLAKYPDIGGAFFHNDDMALAAARVIQRAGRKVLLSGIDAMPPAIQAVIDGAMTATVRNPACRVHWGAMLVGILAATGARDIPGSILTDGPTVTTQNAQGLLFMEEQLLV